MKKIIKIGFFIISLFSSVFTLCSLTEYNEYLDSGLVEKNGTFGLNPYLTPNFISGFISSSTDDYFELGARLKVHYSPKELKGLFFNGEMTMSNVSVRETGGDAAAWWNGTIPWWGETNFGFESRWFDFKLGYQNMVSSTGIYNNLMLDDYSGAFLGYKSNLAITKFFDFQVIMNFVRIHQGPWYTGDATYEWDYIYDSIKLHEDEYSSIDSKYQAKYGKTLYMHKINIRPAPWIRFGLQESVYFLGENLNPYFINPFFLYFATGMIGGELEDKYGTSNNVGANDIKIGLDFSVGFDGWRLYGELMIDDANGEYLKFQQPDHPDRVAFMLGGELRGYLFDKYLPLPRKVSNIIKNLYVNFEMATISRYCFSRDDNYNYEYVREEYPFKYYPSNYALVKNTDGSLKYPDYIEYTEEMSRKINRIGNFIGYKYGSNSDSFDIAIGWRNDLYNVKDSRADYITDRYYESLKENRRPDRLLKMQLHYQHYRLGTDRDVVLPFYMNEHFYYNLNLYDEQGNPLTGEDAEGGTDLRTGFIDEVLFAGDTLDFNIYADLFHFNRGIVGLEMKHSFIWGTTYPNSDNASTEFTYKFDMGIIIGF